NAAMLLITVVLSIFIINRFFNIRATSSRNIDVYIVRCSDSVSSWVGDVDDVAAGVLAAVNDAQTRTKVKFTGEQINVNYVNSAAELEQKVIEAPERAVIINTHGEALPIPQHFFQNDAGSSHDAGDYLSTALSIDVPFGMSAKREWKNYSCWVGSSFDPTDFFNFYVEEKDKYALGIYVKHSMDVDFDLRLYDPDWRQRGESIERSYDERMGFGLDKIGYWSIEVKATSGRGEYTLLVSAIKRSGGSSPDVLYIPLASGHSSESSLLGLDDEGTEDEVLGWAGFFPDEGLGMMTGGCIEEWMDRISDNCREKGWIWANVAGYSFYYASNTAPLGSSLY
ncbi:MAG: hypothetical protein AB1457_19280, partial [Chloroflexota bacterium]